MLRIVRVTNPLLPNPIIQDVVPQVFTIRYNPTDREQKRRFDREVEKCMEHLFGIELSFTRALFDPNADNFVEDYNDMYKVWNDEYIKTAKWLKEHGKLKFIVPNERYFMNEFKPNI